ncbi:MAG: undecaprenyl-diphosphate phosphatase [Bacilli bacterium]|nr:undecaprenyl-diphosphate phosphatase [Bacilli bacterium]
METTFLAVIKAIIYGFIEGITEWLPISSTGHLIIGNTFMGTSAEYGADFWSFFEVVIQLGAILAVVVHFFWDLNPFSFKLTKEERHKVFSLWLKIIIGVLPAGIIGVAFELSGFDAVLDNVYIVATTLIIYGVFFIIIEQIRLKKERDFLVLREMTFYSHNHRLYKYDKAIDLDYKIVLFIGVAQILSLIPGTSRSGVTILAALLLGCSKTCAAQFSFYLSIPVMLGASIIRLVSFLRAPVELTTNMFIYIFVGSGVAFIISMLVIMFFMRIIRKHSFIGFGYYRILVGLVLFGLLFGGIVQPAF